MTNERFRVAMPLTAHFLELSSQLLPDMPEMDFEDVDMYIILDVLSPTEFHGTLVSGEILREEKSRDDSLHILERS